MASSRSSLQPQPKFSAFYEQHPEPLTIKHLQPWKLLLLNHPNLQFHKNHKHSHHSPSTADITTSFTSAMKPIPHQSIQVVGHHQHQPP
ncbi:hypothetical protein M0R45_036440 [Rubus argutus]|uniref:Uncharacterized protein n=1 Tax=Rubus argutus TaxID=59490 RepID=A0AAW1VZQ1_RUBAR